VGLTGGIGSGKSTVACLLEERGAVVTSADEVARDVVSPGSDGLAAVVAEFGEGILAADGSLDRGALGRLTRRTESGYVRSYAGYMLAGTVLVLIAVLAARF